MCCLASEKEDEIEYAISSYYCNQNPQEGKPEMKKGLNEQDIVTSGPS